MTSNKVVVNTLLNIVILTLLSSSCFGFLIQYNNQSLIRNKRTLHCRGKYMCETGSTCISIKQICNGIKDCEDGSDENPNDCTTSNEQSNGSCSPFNVKNGHFNIIGDDYISETLISNYVRVNISCIQNYFLHPNISQITCLDGVWSTTIPQCQPSCPPRISTSSHVNCTLGNKTLDCNERMPEGTVSISTCKDFYTPTYSNISISTCIDGQWDNPLIRCEPECGEVIPDGVVYLISGGDTDRGEFPWLVGIYLLRSSLRYNCGGSIISPTVVLTVAHCIIPRNDQVPYRPEQIFIGAGKYYNGFNDERDKLAQKRKAKQIHIPSEFKKDNYVGDFAMIVVEKPFEMTNVVRPVCIDWESKYESEHLKHNTLGRIAGWGFIDPSKPEISPNLRQLKLPYIDPVECILEYPDFFSRFLTADKYCAGYTNGSAPCNGDSGNGMVFEQTVNNKQKFFIRGLLSVALSKANTSSCDNFHRAVYVRVSSYFDFIKNITQDLEKDKYTCLPRTSSSVNIICSLNGTTVNCNERMEEGTIAVSKCQDFYVMTQKQNTTATCVNGFWDNPPVRCELRGQTRVKTTTCPPRTSDSANIKCLFNDNPVNCNEHLLPGAIAISECKNFYTPKKNQLSISISRCSNGIWNTPLVECEPIQPVNIECGEVAAKGEIHSVNTENSKRGEFPWHVALYKYSKSQYRYNCGGSIISASIVLTAAHCFTDEYGKRFPAEDFFIAAGKYYSDYNAQEDKLAQKRQVMKYHTPPIYKGYETNFAGDIAVVVVKQSFVLNTAVQPVCLEWDDKIESQQLRPENRGSIVGWGSVDPFDVARTSKELKQLNAPYVDVTTCLNNVPQNFRRWVTTDKYCAGYTNGSSVCKGDSGGGMVFEWRSSHKQIYFIRGIVSVGPSDTSKSLICDNFKYGAYTKVSYYSGFILDIIKQHHD